MIFGGKKRTRFWCFWNTTLQDGKVPWQCNVISYDCRHYQYCPQKLGDIPKAARIKQPVLLASFEMVTPVEIRPIDCVIIAQHRQCAQYHAGGQPRALFHTIHSGVKIEPFVRSGWNFERKCVRATTRHMHTHKVENLVAPKILWKNINESDRFFFSRLKNLLKPQFSAEKSESFFWGTARKGLVQINRFGPNISNIWPEWNIFDVSALADSSFEPRTAL